MYLQNPENVLNGQFVKIKYDCDGQSDRCDKEWSLKLKDAKKNFEKNNGKHLCRQCQLKSNNPMSRKEVQEKVKKTSMERYGISCPMNKSELIEERKQKYKDSDFVAKVTSKRKQTSLDKYGVDHPMKTDEVKEKQRQVMQDKYGVDHPLQNAEILEKMKQTNLKRYGVENAAQSPEVRIKMAKSTLERYGVEHYNQLPEMRDYLQTMCREWLAESWANGWQIGLPKSENQKYKQSITVTEKIINGEWTASYKNTKKGRYLIATKCIKQNPFFRSSYELIIHHYLNNNENVEFYDYEPFAIPYDENGKTRHYIPDFIIKYKDSKLLTIIEAKADFMLEDPEIISKINVGKQLSKDNNMNFVIVSNKDMFSFNVSLHELLDSPSVELYQ